jgi:folate-binding protein YgfZ|tara:strand:+ start:1012 stop:1797 length:786 start_codon:yes stop_codon:yes gene_type:complete
MSIESPARLTRRAVISVTGEDARDFLQRVVTCGVVDLADGDIRPGALLTPQGKIIADFLIHGRADGVWIELPTDSAPALVKRLSMYKLRARAAVTLEDGLAVVTGDGASDPRSPRLPRRAIVAASDASGLMVGDEAQSEAEISAGIPAFGRDYGEAEVFPTDVNLDLFGGIGWKKGCFIGQEVVSRMKRRGTIRKRTVRLHCEGQALVAGTDIMLDDVRIGAVTSSAGSTALAVMRLDRLEDARVVQVAGHDAQVDLPDGS